MLKILINNKKFNEGWNKIKQKRWKVLSACKQAEGDMAEQLSLEDSRNLKIDELD